MTAVAVSTGAVVVGAGVVAALCYVYADEYVHKIQIRNLLRKSLMILESFKIKHFLAFGTLLGYIRNGDVIKGDTDGDVCVLETDLNILLNARSAFLKAGIQMDVCGYHLVRLRDLKLPYVYVDLYIIDDDDPIMLGKRLWGTKDAAVLLPKVMIFPLIQTMFFGVPTYIPHKSAALLEHIYGNNWLTHIKYCKGVHSRLTLAQIVGVANTSKLGLMQLLYGD